jgi:multidrug efflux pump subunit AcrA (membrane-fusion protein)
MPDLTMMQVKVGIHESIVDNIKPGQTARITLPDKTLDGTVFFVSPVTEPAGWWNGNVVKYDTIIELPSVDGLKPGMSAEVQIIIDRHMDVLTIPVAAVAETAEGDFCWIKTPEGTKRRLLKLGDTDDSFIVVKTGLKEGEEVVLNPLALIEEAKNEAMKPFEEAKTPEPVNVETYNVE